MSICYLYHHQFNTFRIPTSFHYFFHPPSAWKCYVFALFQLANIMGRFPWLTCPRQVSDLRKKWYWSLRELIVNLLLILQDLSTGWLQCDADPLFKPEPFTLPAWIPGWVSFSILLHFFEEILHSLCQLVSTILLQFPWKEMEVLPVQWHSLCLGLFASIIAPFGGFFASGFKRAFKIKVCNHHHQIWAKLQLRYTSKKKPLLL